MADNKLDIQEEQLVVFDLSGELFAISIERINTIIRMTAITQVPGCDYGVEGVINLRGSILPVMDPRKRFGLELKEADRQSRIVVVEAHGQMIGLIVDAVTETLRLAISEIEPPSQAISNSDTRYVRGIGKAGDKLLILLDIDKLLSEQDVERAMAAVPETELAAAAA